MDDLAPHSAILLVTGEIHERLEDGRLCPTGKGEKIRQVIEIRGDNLALTRENARRAIEHLIERMRDHGIACDPNATLGQAGGGAAGVRPPPPALLGLRAAPARRDGD